MRLSAIIAAIVAMSCAAEPAPAPGELTAAQYQKGISDLGVLVRLQGHDITAAEVLPPSTPIPNMFGGPGSDRASQSLIVYAMAAARRKVIYALAAALIPECSTEPTADDIAAFYPFWRATYAKENGTIQQNGVSRPYPSADDLKAIGPDLPGAKEETDAFIRTWRLDHCVQQKYGGQAFRTTLVGRQALIPVGSNESDLWIEAPFSGVLTPVGALTDLYYAARKAGLLSFPSEAHRKAFADFFNDRPDDCFNDVDAAVAYFATPPWHGGVFPPVAKPQTLLRTSPKGEAGFEVSSSLGWQACIGPSGFVMFTNPALKTFVSLSVVRDNAEDNLSIARAYSAPLPSRFAGFPATQKLGTAALAGVAGDLFGSQMDVSGQQVVLETTIIRLDARTRGIQTIMKVGSHSDAEMRPLDQLLSGVKIVAGSASASASDTSMASAKTPEESACIDNPGVTPDKTIAACTALISSETGANLGVVYFCRGYAYQARGEYDRAIQDYDEAIRLKPDAFVYGNRGSAYHAKGDNDRAIQDYDEAIRLRPDEALAYSGRGIAYRDKGQIDRAIQDFDKDIRLGPDNPYAYVRRGHAYRDKGDNDRAIQDYDQAIRLKPDDDSAYVDRGIAYYHKGQADRAIQDYNEAIRFKSDSAQVYVDRAAAYHVAGQYDRAVQDYDEAIRLKPDDANAFYGRGVTRHAKGQPDLAIQDYGEAIRLKPDDAKAYFARAVVHRAKGQYDLAIKDSSEAIRLKPGDAKAYTLRGDIYSDTRQYDRAILDLSEAIRLNPGDPSAYNGRCWAHATAGRDLAAAAQDCETSLKLRPGDANTLQSRSFVDFRLGRFDAAIADDSAAMFEKANYADALYVRGLARIAKGDRAGGSADIAAAKAIKPGIADEYAGFGVKPPG